MPKLRIDGDARGAIKAAADMRRAVEKAGKTAGTVTGKLDKMTRAARSIREANSPQLRYNRLLSKTAELVNRNKLSLNQATQAAVRYRRALDRANAARGIGGAGGAGRGGFAGAIGGFGKGMGGRLAAGVGAYASVSAIFGLIRREMGRIREFEDSRVASQRGIALSGQRLAQNIAPYSAAERLSLSDLSKRLSIKQGLPLNRLNEATANVISATGDPKLARDILKVTVKLTRDPEQFGEIAGGLGDILFNAPEIKNAVEAAGFLFGVQSQARLVTPGRTAKGLGPVLGAYREASGTSAVVGGALYAAISRGAADKEGNLTTTAVTSFPDRLRTFFERPEIASSFDNEEIDGFDKQLAILMSGRYQDITNEYLHEVRTSFKAKVRQGFVRLLTGDVDIIGTMDAVKRIAGSPEKLRDLAGKASRDASNSRAIVTDRLEGSIQAASDEFKFNTDAKVSSERAREIVDLVAVVRRIGFTSADIDQKLHELNNFTREGLEEYLSEQIKLGRATRSIGAWHDVSRPGELLPNLVRKAIQTPEEMAADKALVNIQNAVVRSQEQTKEVVKRQAEEREEAKQQLIEEKKIEHEQNKRYLKLFQEHEKKHPYTDWLGHLFNVRRKVYEPDYGELDMRDRPGAKVRKYEEMYNDPEQIAREKRLQTQRYMDIYHPREEQIEKRKTDEERQRDREDQKRIDYFNAFPGGAERHADLIHRTTGGRGETQRYMEWKNSGPEDKGAASAVANSHLQADRARQERENAANQHRLDLLNSSKEAAADLRRMATESQAQTRALQKIVGKGIRTPSKDE